MKTNIFAISILLVTVLLAGCTKEMSDEIESLNEFIIKDLSEFENVDVKNFEGTISVYCAKPLEWFVIEKGDDKYCFVITEKTTILNNKGRRQKHQMFNVGTSDIVEIKVKTQCGSLSDDYNDAGGWFVCDTLKILDTLEY